MQTDYRVYHVQVKEIELSMNAPYICICIYMIISNVRYLHVKIEYMRATLKSVIDARY